jgi:hypothetical protein
MLTFKQTVKPKFNHMNYQKPRRRCVSVHSTVKKNTQTQSVESLQKAAYYSEISKNVLCSLVAIGSGIVISLAANECVSKIHEIEYTQNNQYNLVHELKEHQENDEVVISIMYNAIMEFKQIGLA